MIKINVITNNTAWLNFIKYPINYIDRRISKINTKDKTFSKKDIFCTLLLSGNKEIKNLNKKFRKKNKSTDVLSFPFQSKKTLQNMLKKKKEIYLGDIIVNLSQIKCRGNLEKFKSEFDSLWVHGLIHLLGHDHKRDEDFIKMKNIEKRYLNFING